MAHCSIQPRVPANLATAAPRAQKLRDVEGKMDGDFRSEKERAKQIHEKPAEAHGTAQSKRTRTQKSSRRETGEHCLVRRSGRGEQEGVVRAGEKKAEPSKGGEKEPEETEKSRTDNQPEKASLPQPEASEVDNQKPERGQPESMESDNGKSKSGVSGAKPMENAESPVTASGDESQNRIRSHSRSTAAENTKQVSREGQQENGEVVPKGNGRKHRTEVADSIKSPSMVSGEKRIRRSDGNDTRSAQPQRGEGNHKGNDPTLHGGKAGRHDEERGTYSSEAVRRAPKGQRHVVKKGTNQGTQETASRRVVEDAKAVSDNPESSVTNRGRAHSSGKKEAEPAPTEQRPVAERQNKISMQKGKESGDAESSDNTKSEHSVLTRLSNAQNTNDRSQSGTQEQLTRDAQGPMAAGQHALRAKSAPARESGQDGPVRRAAQRASVRVQEEVVRHARLARKQGRSEITVQLDPPELGRMKVVIAREEGKLNVHINVENPEFRSALRGEIPELERSLRENQGWEGRTDVSDFEHSEGDHQPSSHKKTDSEIRGSSVGAAVTQIDEPETWKMFGQTREVDCLV